MRLRKIKQNILSLLLVLPLTIYLAYPQAGLLDVTLDSDGKLMTDFANTYDAINSMVQQPDGKIVAAGYSQFGPYGDFSVCRYLSDGSLDPTFSADGKVTTDIGGNDDKIYSVALQPDGKILTAGYAVVGGNYAVCLVRYNADGTLDPSFSADGIVTTNVGPADDYAYSIAIQGDGKIVIAGHAMIGFGFDFLVIRYNDDGTLDTSFATGGIKVVAVGAAGDLAYSMLLQPDGKIVVAGYSDNGSNEDQSMIRLNADGSLDNSFSGDGKVITDFAGNNENCYACALQPDGKIILAGYTGVGSLVDFIVARYNPDGSLDGSFGSSGSTTTSISANVDIARSIALQPDWKIIVAGYSWGGTDLDFSLARYNSNGVLDNTFNSGGTILTNFGSGGDLAYSIILQQDLKILAGGSAYSGSLDDFALARYISGLNVGIINFTNSNHSILVYPNPIVQTAILEYELTNTEEISIHLVNLKGEIVETFRNKVVQNSGPHSELIDIPNSISPGRYFLSISTPSGGIVIQIIYVGN